MKTSSTLEVSLRRQRPVICAVDRDGLAQDVVSTASAVAAQFAVPLTVVHSAAPDLFLSGEARRVALEQGDAFLDDLLAGYTVDERVVDIDDPARLVAAVAEAGATMIVIGTRRRGGIRSALLGSVSHAVIESAECPVLTVPSLSEFAARDSQAEPDAFADPLDLLQSTARCGGHASGSPMRDARRWP
jgi:nucleotide-binding universal stress UspA family protein